MTITNLEEYLNKREAELLNEIKELETQRNHKIDILNCINEIREECNIIIKKKR